VAVEVVAQAVIVMMSCFTCEHAQERVLDVKKPHVLALVYEVVTVDDGFL